MSSIPEAPDNANATRRSHFRRMMHGRAVGYALGLGVLAMIGLGLLIESLPIAGYGSAFVIVAVISVTFAIADRRAEQDFFLAFARAHGFSYSRGYQLPAFTPLLGAGDRRQCENYMEGPLRRGRSGPLCALTNYRFDVKREGIDENGASSKDYASCGFTLCVVELGGEQLFPGVFLAGHHSHKAGDEGTWLRKRGFVEVSLESSRFAKRYDLLVDPRQDQIALRQLFTPSLIVWLAGHPLAPRFEFRAGVLVVYVGRYLSDGAHLQWLLDATREIAARFEREIADFSARSAA